MDLSIPAGLAEFVSGHDDAMRAADGTLIDLELEAARAEAKAKRETSPSRAAAAAKSPTAVKSPSKQDATSPPGARVGITVASDCFVNM